MLLLDGATGFKRETAQSQSEAGSYLARLDPSRTGRLARYCVKSMLLHMISTASPFDLVCKNSECRPHAS